MKMLREGSWWIHSKSDSRWNENGHSMVGMFSMPSEAQKFIDEKKKELNEEAPADLEFGYMKD